MRPPPWHIITGEYAPAHGGVADYSRSLACALASAGDEVHVWAPADERGLASNPGVRLHPLPLGYGPRGLRALGRELQQEPAPRRLLVQYVPQAFGMRGMNVPFCVWVASLRNIQVYVMFHEVAMPWDRPSMWKRNAASAVTRVMANLLAARADGVLVSIPPWEAMLRKIAPHWRGRATWLPIPSNLPGVVSASTVASTRASLRLTGSSVIGHFGTYGSLVAGPLEEIVLALLADTGRIALLIGRGSDGFARRLLAIDPALEGRVVATGDLDPASAAAHLRACDVLVQPYPDGVSSRRTTVMAGLALGVPIATNEGFLSEPIWRQSQAVELAFSTRGIAAAAEAILGDVEHSARLSERGRLLYDGRFALRHTVSALQTATGFGGAS